MSDSYRNGSPASLSCPSPALKGEVIVLGPRKRRAVDGGIGE